MSVKSQKVATKSAPAAKENVARGVGAASLAIVLGAILWIVLWSYGFMASFVAFAIAWLAVRLYKRGSGGSLSRKGTYWVLGIIALGIVLAFLSGMVSDALYYYQAEYEIGALAALASADFWDYWTYNIFANGELWGSYTADIVIAVVFGVLGAFEIVKSLLIPGSAPKADTKK